MPQRQTTKVPTLTPTSTVVPQRQTAKVLTQTPTSTVVPQRQTAKVPTQTTTSTVPQRQTMTESNTDVNSSTSKTDCKGTDSNTDFNKSASKTDNVLTLTATLEILGKRLRLRYLFKNDFRKLKDRLQSYWLNHGLKKYWIKDCRSNGSDQLQVLALRPNSEMFAQRKTSEVVTQRHT